MAGARKEKLPSGLYQGWYKGIRNGKIGRIFFVGTSSYSETKRIAQKLEDEHRQIILGYREAPSASQRHRSTSYDKVAAEYLAWGNAQGGRNGFPWSERHARRSRLMLEEFWKESLKLETMGDLYGILPGVEKMIRQLIGDDKAGKTIQHNVSILRAFCRWCVDREYLSENPIRKLAKIDGTPKSHRRALTKDELARIFDVIVANPDRFEYWLVLLPVSCCTGLRSGAIKALTIDHLDLQRGEIRLDAPKAKNRKDGFKEISPELAGLVSDYYHSGKPKALYAKHYARTDATQQPPKKALVYVPSHPARELDKILKLAGIDKTTEEGKIDFHASRVAFATFIVEAGATIKEAQAALDHSDPRITSNVYARTRNGRMHELMDDVTKPVFDLIKCAYSVHDSKNGDPKENCNPFHMNELQSNLCGGGGGNRTPVLRSLPYEHLRAQLSFVSHAGVRDNPNPAPDRI